MGYLAARDVALLFGGVVGVGSVVLGVINGVQRQWVEMSGNIAVAVGMACLFVSFEVSFKRRR
jgi:hypothetical protein